MRSSSNSLRIFLNRLEQLPEVGVRSEKIFKIRASLLGIYFYQNLKIRNPENVGFPNSLVILKNLAFACFLHFNIYFILTRYLLPEGYDPDNGYITLLQDIVNFVLIKSMKSLILSFRF